MTRKQQTSLFNIMDNIATQSAAENAPAPESATSEPSKPEPTKVAHKESAPKAPAAVTNKAKKTSTHADSVRTSSLDEIYSSLVSGLKKYFTKNNFKRAVLGVSGGVDSALVLKIAVDALGADNVTALIMPELGISKPENMDHAKVLCEYFGVTIFYQPINSFLMDFSTPPWKPSALAQMNTKARIRAVLLYNYANTEQALVLGTSNKSELLLGYGTKYGDLAADIEVIGELFKTEVVKLADHIGLPPEIAHKPPTAELSPGQTDEAEIGATYYDLDKVLMRLDEGVAGCLDRGLPMSLVQLVFRRYEENKHKLQSPPSIKIS